MIQLGDVLPFLSNEEIGSPATISKLTAILSDQSKNVYLQIKLAAVVDVGKISSRQLITLKAMARFLYHVFK